MEKKNLIELFVYSQNKTTKDGRKFTKYSTKANFKMRNEDGSLSNELAPHFITLKFTSDAFDGSNVKISDVKRGKLVVDGKFIGLPTVYEIKVNENGESEYPQCWIRGGIESFTPVEKPHTFNFIVEEDTNEVELEDSND